MLRGLGDQRGGSEGVFGREPLSGANEPRQKIKEFLLSRFSLFIECKSRALKSDARFWSG